MKLDSDIKRIVSNENIVTELETINKILVNESDRCKFYTLGNETIGKYGLTRNSLIERVLALFLFAQPKQELKTANRIHYESEKDAEANKESEWISVNDRMPEEFRRESKYIEFKTLSGMLIDGYSKRNAFYDSKYGSIITSIVTHWKYKNNEPKEENDWISVKDRMPEESKFKAEDYLVFNDQGEIEVCFINNRVFRDKREDRNVIASHWRHLPEPPKNN